MGDIGRPPRVQLIVNAAVASKCADVALAAGGAPVMGCTTAEEARECASKVDVTLLNFGTPTKERSFSRETAEQTWTTVRYAVESPRVSSEAFSSARRSGQLISTQPASIFLVPLRQRWRRPRYRGGGGVEARHSSGGAHIVGGVVGGVGSRRAKNCEKK